MTELATEAGAMVAQGSSGSNDLFLIGCKSVSRANSFHYALSYLDLQRLALDASFGRKTRQKWPRITLSGHSLALTYGITMCNLKR